MGTRLVALLGELVEAARRDALEAARQAGVPKNTVAIVSWMNDDDR